MNDTVLEQKDDQVEAEEEEFAPNPDLTAEEMADDQLAHLLLTAWITLLKEDQELV